MSFAMRLERDEARTVARRLNRQNEMLTRLLAAADGIIAKQRAELAALAGTVDREEWKLVPIVTGGEIETLRLAGWQIHTVGLDGDGDCSVLVFRDRRVREAVTPPQSPDEKTAEAVTAVVPMQPGESVVMPAAAEADPVTVGSAHIATMDVRDLATIIAPEPYRLLLQVARGELITPRSNTCRRWLRKAGLIDAPHPTSWKLTVTARGRQVLEAVELLIGVKGVA